MIKKAWKKYVSTCKCLIIPKRFDFYQEDSDIHKSELALQVQLDFYARIILQNVG